MGRIYAHRVNSLDFEVQPTFNIRDTDLNDMLEDLGHFYGQAGYKLSVADLDVLILRLKDTDPMQAASFKRDRRWAELHRTEWVHYHVIGDDYDGEKDDDHLKDGT